MDEAWLHRAPLPESVRPLLALVLDRSQATGVNVPVTEDYDPLRDYAAMLADATRCDPRRVYFRRGPGPAPDCARQEGVDLDPRDFASGLHCEAARASLATAGFHVASRAAQWRAGVDGGHWDAPRDDGTGAVECRADRGRHGNAAGDWYAGEGTGEPWTRDASSEIPWDRSPWADPYIFYSGNYLNYLHATPAVTDRSIAEVMARRLGQALAATAELEVALLRVDDDGPDGGFVARAPVPSDTAAIEVLGWAAMPPAGPAPLSETLTEAARWLAGAPRRFGLDARTDTSALDPRADGMYRSPFTHACRPVSMGYLSAGVASDDDQAAAAADSLPHFHADTGGCGADCGATLSAWLGTTDLRDDLPGAQSAPVRWITPSLDGAAADSTVFTNPLAYVNLIAHAHVRDAAAAARPQLSAAALMPFDSRPGAAGVVFGLTAPRPGERWVGNVLQYALRAPAGPFEPPLIVDRDDMPAIAADGLPGTGTQSLWSDAPDANLLTGGAAGRLPVAEARNLYTDAAGNRLTDPANRLDAFRDERLLGDPGLQGATIVDYPEAGLRIAFVATQDGVLHALDGNSGVELWGWMPKELLGRIPALVLDAPTTVRSHGIDGALVVHRHDPNGDGRIEQAAGEHLWLLFGLGRGGARYYALDIAAPRDPRLLWSVELPDPLTLGLAEPVVAQLGVAGAGQGTDDWIVMLAGGYDRRFDAPGAAGTGRGGTLLAIDAPTGRRLWSAGGDGDDLAVAGVSSLAAAPRLLDLDGDDRIDRAYVVDVEGSLWRFDFESGREASTLATARRLARLDAVGRRFHFPPDASVVRTGMQDRLAIAMASGALMRPRDLTAEDALFVVYDVISGTPAEELAEADLHDASLAGTGIPPDAPGWFVRLDAHGAGEKASSTIVTFNHTLRFQSYQPQPPDPAAPCGPPASVARRYAIDIRTALPVSTAVESQEDEPEEIEASGLPPGLKFGFPGRWDEACNGCKPRPFGILGGETFDTGYAGDPVRTSWRKRVPPPASP
jgi:type IV pilus assembly protein PilY1